VFESLEFPDKHKLNTDVSVQNKTKLDVFSAVNTVRQTCAHMFKENLNSDKTRSSNRVYYVFEMIPV